jgi:hypothetical protein
MSSVQNKGRVNLQERGRTLERGSKGRFDSDLPIDSGSPRRELICSDSEDDMDTNVVIELFIKELKDLLNLYKHRFSDFYYFCVSFLNKSNLSEFKEYLLSYIKDKKMSFQKKIDIIIFSRSQLSNYLKDGVEPSYYKRYIKNEENLKEYLEYLIYEKNLKEYLEYLLKYDKDIEIYLKYGKNIEERLKHNFFHYIFKFKSVN